MAVSQLFKLMKEWDRHSIVFWLGTRDPEFWWTITRVKKPEGLAALSKEKREILKQLFERREAAYKDMAERRSNIDNNHWDPNHSDNSDDLNDLSPNTEETAS